MMFPLAFPSITRPSMQTTTFLAIRLGLELVLLIASDAEVQDKDRSSHSLITSN
jgi:hypothetical protein